MSNLKITRNNMTLLIPPYWLNQTGFLKHTAVWAVKLFFGDCTLEEALQECEKNIRYSWYGTITMKKGGRKKIPNTYGRGKI